jgi:hypothetical protein
VFFRRNPGFLNIIIYLGNGIEGWPDVIHGGVLSTILKDAMERVAAEVFPPGTGEVQRLNIQFRKKVMAGEVYSLCAVPAGNVVTHGNESLETQFKMHPSERRNAVIAYIERLDVPINEASFSKTTHAFGYGVFNVKHPLQMDEHGNIT